MPFIPSNTNSADGETCSAGSLFPSVAPQLDEELRASGIHVVLTVHGANDTSLAFIPIEGAPDTDYPSDILHTIADRFRSDVAFRMGMAAYLTHVGEVYEAVPPASTPIADRASAGPNPGNVVALQRTPSDVADIVA